MTRNVGLSRSAWTTYLWACTCSPPASCQARHHPLQPPNKLLPPVIRPLVVGLLVRPKPGLLHPHERSTFRRNQRPDHDTLEPHRAPGIGKLLVGLDDHHLA